MAAKKAKTEPTLLQQAKAGNAQAMFRLSVTLQDDAEAALWLRKAAAKGVAPAQNNLGVMLAQGTGGALLFNVSKQAVNPGRGFGPYGLPKAATLFLLRTAT